MLIFGRFVLIVVIVDDEEEAVDEVEAADAEADTPPFEAPPAEPCCPLPIESRFCIVLRFAPPPPPEAGEDCCRPISVLLLPAEEPAEGRNMAKK